MTEEQKQLLKEYAVLKREEKAVAKQIKDRKDAVLNVLLENKVDEVELEEGGKFIVYPRRTYTYSDSVRTKDKELTAAKEAEEQDGTATYEENPFFQFR
jgi:hypothetical protein